MKFAVMILMSLLAVNAPAASNGVALRSDESGDSFSTCAARAAAGAADSFFPDRVLYIQSGDGPAPFRFANLFISVKTANGAEKRLQLMIKSPFPDGWNYVQAESGEIYLFAEHVEPTAFLVDPKSGTLLGLRDISRCL